MYEKPNVEVLMLSDDVICTSGLVANKQTDQINSNPFSELLGGEDLASLY